MLLHTIRAQLFAQLANPKGTKLYKLQKQFQRQFGFTLREFRLTPHPPTITTRSISFCLKAIFHGRGILNCEHVQDSCVRPPFKLMVSPDWALPDTIGFLPYRHPIVSVVGRPIRVTQADNPSMAQMQDVQQRYIAELTRCVRACARARNSRPPCAKARFADGFPLGVLGYLVCHGVGHRIWDTHKDTYAVGRKRELSIVD